MDAAISEGKHHIAVILLMLFFGRELMITKITAAQNETNTTETDLNATTITTTLHSISSRCYDLRPPGRPSDCQQYKYLCNDEEYYNFMTWQCPETCGRCWALTVTTPRTGIFKNGTCIDLAGPNGLSDCSKYAFLCQHSHYGSLMATECPRTCGHCPTNNPSYHPIQ